MKEKHNGVICMFQDKVSKLHLRHRSILDSLSKNAESAININRAITKTVTACGCISVNASKQQLPADISLGDYQNIAATHLEGSLCENCREEIEEEIGSHLFYLTALCHLLNFELEDVLQKEYERLNALGLFRLS